MRMMLLKPSGRLRRLTLGPDQSINLLAESGIAKQTLNLILRDSLQHDPRIVSEFPERGIKLPPYFVGRVIPRPAQIQSQLGQGIETLDFGG